MKRELYMPIINVQCDAKGWLWLYTDVHTRVAYHPRTGQVVEDVETLLHSWGMNVWYDFELLVDDNGRIWIWKDDHIYRYNPLNEELKQLTLKGYGQSPAHPYFNWCIQGNYVCIVSKDNLYLLDADAMQVINREHLPFLARFPVLNMDNQGNIWLGVGRELYCRSVHSGEWNHVTTTSSFVQKILQLDGQTMCVSTLSTGLYLFGIDGKYVWHCLHDPLEAGSLQNDHITDLYVDKVGCLCVSYQKRGLSVFHPNYEGEYVRHVPSLQAKWIPDDILAFALLSDGTWALGTDGHGIRRVDSEGNEQGMPLDDGTAIVTLLTDSKNRLWAGTFQQGLLSYGAGGRKHYLQHLSCYSIAEDRLGMLYVGTLGEGLYRINPKTDEVQEVSLPPDGGYILNMVSGADGLLYAASTGGLLIVNPATLRVDLQTGNRQGTQRFSRKVLKSVVYDSRKLLWILCDCGIGVVNVLDVERDSIMAVPGLADYSIMAMVEDGDGNLWMTSDKGLLQVKVFPTLQGGYDFCVYSYQMHSTLDYNISSAARLSDQCLAFGTINGYQVVRPRNLELLKRDRSEENGLCISSLYVNNKSILPGDTVGGRVLLPQDIRFTQRLELDYDENNLQLELFCADYGIPFKRMYAYRLAPLDKDFRSIDGNIVTLNDLPPGKYCLYAKESDSDGNRQSGIITLDILVRPPFLKSPMAYVLYICLCLFIVAFVFYYWYKWQRYKMRLRQVELEAERQYQMNEMKLRFFTNISHDFRTPLSLIITPLTDFLERTQDAKIKTFLRPVHRNALRLLGLVNQILDFRKLEMYGNTLTLSYGDIVSFLQEVCSSFTLLADEVHCDLQFRSAVDRLETSFDKDKMGKIMMNLLSNAFKYTPPEGSIVVSFEVWNDNWQVKVADTGPGIPDVEKERIFDRFYQVSHDGNQTGSGIGLHIAREFVKLHKGEIRVEDNQPHGSIFCVSIPIQKTTQSVALVGPSREIVLEKDLRTSQSDGKKILLLVEDNPDFLNYLTHTLSDEYCILQAYNGKNAWNLLEKEQVDVVISDVMMNEMDGLALCQTIKSNLDTSHIPVILLTAKTLEEDELKGFEMGADDYITKPFNVSILRHRINSLLERNRRSHERFQKELEIVPSEITVTSLDEQLLAQAIGVVEENMENPDFSVEMLSDRLNMHRSSFYKKIMVITGKKPVEFIRLLRLKRAMQLLEKSQLYVADVAYKVGFNSPRIFAKYFREEFGVSPSEYQKSKRKEEKDDIESA